MKKGFWISYPFLRQVDNHLLGPGADERRHGAHQHTVPLTIVSGTSSSSSTPGGSFGSLASSELNPLPGTRIESARLKILGDIEPLF